MYFHLTLHSHIYTFFNLPNQLQVTISQPVSNIYIIPSSHRTRPNPHPHNCVLYRSSTCCRYAMLCYTRIRMRAFSFTLFILFYTLSNVYSFLCFLHFQCWKIMYCIWILLHFFFCMWMRFNVCCVWCPSEYY